MEDEEECNVGLCLGLGNSDRSQNKIHKPVPVSCFDFSFTLFPKEEAMDVQVLREEYVNISSQNDKNISRGKKLRLSKEQSNLLEESFKLHTTLNSFQKRALAEQLKLKPRQVEVWFQNRRARTKLKQTEIEYEFLKKCCESLSDENSRLKKELQELQSIKFGRSPLYSTKTTALCPSCETITRTK